MATMAKWHDGTEFDFDGLPDKSREALISRAVAHVMGNEASSKVVAKIRAACVNGSDRKAADVTTDEIKTFRAAHEADGIVNDWTLEEQNKLRDAILAGELGMRASGGPSKSQVQKDREQAAEELLRDLYMRAGKPLPEIRAGKGVKDYNDKVRAIVAQRVDQFLNPQTDAHKAVFAKHERAYNRRLEAIVAARAAAKGVTVDDVGDLGDLAA